jgi:hypothetical protein
MAKPLAARQKSLPLFWDVDLVGRRLVQAFVTFDRLPRLRSPREPGERADQLGAR